MVKGLLERLITHFGLGSSKGEEPCGVFCLLGRTLLFGKHCPGGIPFGEQHCLTERPCHPPQGVPACLALSLSECLIAWGSVELCLESGILWGRGETCLGELTLFQWKRVVFWGSLGTACLGDLTLLVKECYLPGKPGTCLPGRAHSLLVKSAIFGGSLGTACLGECTLCWWKSAIFQGSLGTACLGDLTLCWWKSAIYWGSLGIACLGENPLCQWECAVSQGSLGPACLGEVALGKSSFFQGRLRGLRGST